eukprot:gnl/Chilomastix_cuspidata/3504.p1 GENE.gnl/Chilomastix_cuspidata/3504~~gnl/Chilomastix_cuspidata/3504.p1  ORF type:complete len:214 (+),score=85.94 gnl/Chilomastix_cuspidata/3504:215-856(+)
MELLTQGAEARLYASTMFGRPCIIKQRFEKTYRHPDIDKKLRRSRTAKEAKTICRAAQRGLPVPALYFVDTKACAITMERIEGPTAKELLLALEADVVRAAEADALAQRIGAAVAAFHNAGIIHGDLTTSNVLVADAARGVVLIDFGLTQTSVAAEDRAVDLYGLERAIDATHAGAARLFALLLDAYCAHAHDAAFTRKRLQVVRARGRKKSV